MSEDSSARVAIIEGDNWLSSQPEETIERLKNMNLFTLAKYLYNRDVSKFDPNKIPDTVPQLTLNQFIQLQMKKKKKTNV